MPQPKTRRLDGIVLLDKPLGLSSNQALQKVKRLFQADKAGHTGALDPLATGMLPICLGEATKVSAFLLDARKRYRVVARLGQATDTADAEGTVVEEAEIPPLTPQHLETVLDAFRGESEQIPPMYSALKHHGKRLYQLARQGQTVERPARKIRIDELRLCTRTESSLELEVLCSKGTYIRTLVEDIARALGTVGHVASLRRTAVEPFDGLQMASLETLQSAAHAGELETWLLPIDRALVALPAVRLDAEQARRLSQGQTVSVSETALPVGPLRLYHPSGRLLGLGEAAAGGCVRPKRLFVDSAEAVTTDQALR